MKGWVVFINTPFFFFSNNQSPVHEKYQNSLKYLSPKMRSCIQYNCCSVARLCPTLCNSMDCSTPDLPVLHYLSEFAQVHVHWDGDTIQLSHLLPPSSPFALSLPSIRVFSNESALHIRWPKDWSFSISPSNEYSRMISFSIAWFDLFSDQRTLKSLLQQHNWKHQFFGAQPSLWSKSHIHTWLLEKP